MLRIVTHQTTGAEHTGPPERIKTHKVCSFIVFRNQFGHKNEVGVGTGDATEPPEKAAEGARPGLGTEGLRRQYHGKGPRQDSIALSQVVEGGGERRQRTEAGRGYMEGSTLSVSENAFPFYSTAMQTVPMLLTAAVRDEPGRNQRIATEELTDYYPAAGRDSWVGPGPSLRRASGRP